MCILQLFNKCQHHKMMSKEIFTLNSNEHTEILPNKNTFTEEQLLYGDMKKMVVSDKQNSLITPYPPSDQRATIRDNTQQNGNIQLSVSEDEIKFPDEETEAAYKAVLELTDKKEKILSDLIKRIEELLSNFVSQFNAIYTTRINKTLTNLQEAVTIQEELNRVKQELLESQNLATVLFSGLQQCNSFGLFFFDVKF